MIKLKATQQFTLNDFDKLKNIKRATINDKEGELFVNDEFECDEKLARYLLGDNDKNIVVVKVIEISKD